jgi:hypothetical protein
VLDSNLAIVWDRLRDAFVAAQAAAARGDSVALRRAVMAGRTSATQLYMELDPGRDPELATHIHAVLDLCMTHLDRVARDASTRLDVPLGLLEAMAGSCFAAEPPTTTRRVAREVSEDSPAESGFRLASAAPARLASIAVSRAG